MEKVVWLVGPVLVILLVEVMWQVEVVVLLRLKAKVVGRLSCSSAGEDCGSGGSGSGADGEDGGAGGGCVGAGCRPSSLW